MKLNVLISTIDSGIEKINNILLPIRADLEYIISHQYTDNKYKYIPKELKRPDVFISQIFGIGLTKSRNNAIKHANGDVCIISDDDVKYTNEYFDIVKKIYENNKVDIACFKIFTGENQKEYKKYPNHEIDLKDLHIYSPSSIELTFKLNTIEEKKILFDERFGLGSWLNGGEENIFVYDAIKANLRVRFFPFYIVQHPYESTIKSFPKYAKRRTRVTGAFDARVNGFISIPKSFFAMFKFYSELKRDKKNHFRYFLERLSGAIYILISNYKF